MRYTKNKRCIFTASRKSAHSPLPTLHTTNHARSSLSRGGVGVPPAAASMTGATTSTKKLHQHQHLFVTKQLGKCKVVGQ